MHENHADESTPSPSLIPLSADDAIDCGAYHNALDQAFANNRVKNIGVIGPHASGKTSLLKSYDRSRNEKQLKALGRFAYITLGDYVRSEGNQPDGDASEFEVTAELQRRVIEQLLCHIPPKAVWRASVNPLFRTMRRRRVDILHFLAILVAILSGFIAFDMFGVVTATQESFEQEYVVKQMNDAVDDYVKEQEKALLSYDATGKAKRQPGNTSTINDEEAEKVAGALDVAARIGEKMAEVEDVLRTNAERRATQNSPYPAIFRRIRLGCLAVCGISIAVGFLRFKSKSIMVKGVTTGAGSISMEKNALPFDTHIDDLLYLMGLTNGKVFLFEDIDRVDQHSRILSSLRELNFKLNTSIETRDAALSGSWWRRAWRTIRRHKPTRQPPYKFVYCMQSDCIVDAEERTKFFDLIIPVVPFGDFSNFGGRLCDYFENTPYKIDQGLLRQAGRALGNMRMYENCIDAFIVQRNVLHTPEGMPSEVFDSSLFALTAYKNLCPADYYALVEQESGYLHNLLVCGRNVLTAEPSANRQSEDDELPTVPFVEIARRHGDEPWWEKSITQYLESVAPAATEPQNSPAIDSRTRLFVRYCIERGYIRERFHLFTSHTLGQMKQRDREFCLRVDSRYWPKKSASEPTGQDMQDHALSDPALVAQWLRGTSYAHNTTLLNASLLYYLLHHISIEEGGSSELTFLLDDMVGMMADESSEDGIRFLSSTLGSTSGADFLRVLSSDRYAASQSAFSFGTIRDRLGGDVQRIRLAAVSLLRMAARVGGRAMEQWLPGKDELVQFILEDRNFLDVWTDIRLPEDTPVVLPEKRDECAAVEVAKGLQEMGVCLPRIFTDTLSGWDTYSLGAMDCRLVMEVYRRDLYEITADNVEFILERLEEADTRTRTRMLTVIYKRLDEESPIFLRLAREKERFVSMVVDEIRTIDDTLDTAEKVLCDDSLSEDLRERYRANLRHRDN